MNQITQCWHCRRPLVPVMNPKSKQHGQISFRYLILKTGEAVPVHHKCHIDAQSDQRVETARISETGRYSE